MDYLTFISSGTFNSNLTGQPNEVQQTLANQGTKQIKAESLQKLYS